MRTFPAKQVAELEREALELTILMPCLNEARTLPACIGKATAYLERTGIRGEVLIADNGSTDGSQEIARAHGARVHDVKARGYGAALMGGIGAARGRFVVMGDADDSYDFSRLDGFVAALRAGFDLVMGNRFAGGIEPGAMPPLHRYLGNPVLTGIGRVLFRSPVRDFHCGLRGFRRDAIAALDLQAPGMEFASEMVVRATIGRLRITEVPTTLSRDGRGRPPHLRSWRDGWRHLRFLLLFSPRSVFLYPGALLFCLGLAMMLVLLPGPLRLGPVTLDVHTLFYATTFVVVGFQSMLFWAFSKIHAMNERFLPPDPGFLRVMEKITLEVGLIASAVLLLSGLGASLLALGIWGMGHFGTLSPIETLRIVIPAGTAIIVGVQVAYASFFIGVVRIRSSRSRAADRA